MIQPPPPCRRCKSSEVKHTQFEDSDIQWFICRDCGHVWCAPNPRPTDNRSRGMSAFPWRRHHGHDIVAEVTIAGRGLWSVAALRQSNPSVKLRTAKLHSWDSACAKADALARQAFAHTCLGTCGDWFAVLDGPREQSDRLSDADRRRYGPRLPRDHTS